MGVISMTKHLLTLLDFSKEEIIEILELSKKIKEHPEKFSDKIKGKSVYMYFEKSSTRTMASMYAGVNAIGGQAFVLTNSQFSVGKESLADTVKTLERYTCALAGRVYKQELLEEWAKYSKVPVINLLSDKYHPCQALADYLTILEHIEAIYSDGKINLEKIKGKSVAFIGDGNNVCASLAICGLKLGFSVKVATPKGYELESNQRLKDFLEDYKDKKYFRSYDSKEIVKDVDFVYTDVWTSMGQEQEKEERLKLFRPYQVNEELMGLTNNAKFLHCLPAERGNEVTKEVIDGKNSIVFDEAENRMWTEAGVILYLNNIRG